MGRGRDLGRWQVHPRKAGLRTPGLPAVQEDRPGRHNSIGNIIVLEAPHHMLTTSCTSLHIIITHLGKQRCGMLRSGVDLCVEPRRSLPAMNAARCSPWLQGSRQQQRAPHHRQRGCWTWVVERMTAWPPDRPPSQHSCSAKPTV